MAELDFDSKNIKALFQEICLHSPKGEFYKNRFPKYQQVFAYITQIKAVLNKLSKKRPIILLDCGCGKSYLSFVLYEYSKTILNRNIEIIGIDNNEVLINKCKKTAKELHFHNMQFYSSTIEEFTLDKQVDIIYSLHACDTATDQTIAKGIELGTQYIFSVSCCQHTIRKKMGKHPLKSITRYKPYKERLVDMIGDSMRALLLEHLCYNVKIFEFIAAEHTPKNMMLRAIKHSIKKHEREKALSNYYQLKQMFNFSPALENLLRSYLNVED